MLRGMQRRSVFTSVVLLLLLALHLVAITSANIAVAAADGTTASPSDADIVTVPLPPASHAAEPSALATLPPPPPPPPRLGMCAQGSSGADTLLDYEYLVKCTSLHHTRGLAELLLLVLLAALLYLLSSTADSFFCPVLQVIVEKYRIPPDIAGVTFLSFGNGSPDVFSNIAAFSLSTPNIGVASILGGGLLVTTVIVASVGFASVGQPQQLIPRKFMRDVAFYFVAVAYFCFVCFDGTVHLPEALGFLALYALYALTVLFDATFVRLATAAFGPHKLLHRSSSGPHSSMDDFYGIDWVASPYASGGNGSSSGSSWSDNGSNSSSPHERPLLPLTKPLRFLQPAFDVVRIRDYSAIKSNSNRLLSGTGPNELSYDSDSSSSLGLPPPQLPLHRKTSAPTPRSKQIEADQPPLPAHEQQSLLERTDTYMSRPASVCLSSMPESRQIRHRRRRSERHKRTAWESVEASAHFGVTARRWTRSYQNLLSGIEEFPSSVSEPDEQQKPLDGVDEETGACAHPPVATGAVPAVSTTSCRAQVVAIGCSVASLLERVMWRPFELATTFVRRLTIPLVDDETWDKSFAVACPPFVLAAVGQSLFAVDIRDPVFVLVVVVGGGVASLAIDRTTSNAQPPEGHRLVPFVAIAFVMSVIWIMHIADELLGVLQALGGLFGISNSVLGVSVLAWGNSIGDLVSNTSIARDGFPTMAFAGCFAGPMFNLLVGIGLALTIAVVSNGPVAMGTPTPLVYLGFGYLLTSLALNVGLAALDGFQYRRRLCYVLLALYASFAVLSIAVVLSYPEQQ